MADGLARQIAGLAGDIARVGRRIPSYQRGVVANVSPPTVVMDRDVTATPRPVADVLVPGLAVGQRVEVRVIGSRRVITSIHPADTDTGWFNITLAPRWEVLGSSVVACRRMGDVVYWRGRIAPTQAHTGMQVIAAPGIVPEWARPPDVYASMMPVVSHFAWTTAEQSTKSAAVYPSGQLSAFVGNVANSDPIILSGLSGYLVT